MNSPPRVAITMGDPVGVGPELALRLLALRSLRKTVTPVVIGDEGLLNKLAKKLKIRAPKKGEVINLSSLNTKTLKAGKPTKSSSVAMISYITRAVELTQKGEVDAITTMPISKAAAKKAGFNFPGHTEFLAKLTKTKDYSMMLGGDKLKVVLVTIHEAIKKVPRLITKESVWKTIKVTDDSFKKYFGYKAPRIAVAGLNPHAGEGGLFGTEDDKIIAPQVKKATQQGIKATGPLPPDTAFYRALKGDFDCVIAMYHDQGLGPLKLIHFEDGVNVTLGLNIIRTSVDHGTAYDIAWKGRADVRSAKAAVEMAASMAKKNKKARK